MRLSHVFLIALVLPLAACEYFPQGQPAPAEPKIGKITRTLRMVDGDGTIYGTVELDPINGGTVTDAQGRIIGRIVTPAPAQMAPTVPMPANGY